MITSSYGLTATERVLPRLALDFTTGILDPRVTFTRATTGTFTGSNGFLQTAAINAPRFDYNPTTLAPLGLLIEEQRSNLLLYSQEFDNAATWVKSSTTVTANTTTAPDGTTTADQLTTIALLSVHGINQTVSSSASARVASVFAKKGTNNYIQFCTIGDAVPFANFDLDLGVVGTKAASVTSSITAFPYGWYHCTIEYTSAATTGLSIEVANSASMTRRASWTATGTETVFLWGAQLEAGAFATSYIPTVASQVTRSADNAIMTGTNFSSWYNASEGTFFANIISAPVNNIVQVAWWASDATANNYIFTRRNTAGQLLTGMVTATVLQSDITSGGAIAGGATYKTSFAYKTNNLAISTNGAAVGTDSLATLPVVSQINLGANSATAQILNGTIRQFSFYPQRLINAELQAFSK